ncbi:hypothetical protein BDFB_004017 [Asbolus verrucosus]|uniref:7tm 6 domain containing protein n=1 Tax=Asbolus verrucosus TaxID=1661398 RepID=A0A482W1E9_ASBVE|nr:hypothetical protein BDFB_004017 [Asbolus verrucosus]
MIMNFGYVNDSVYYFIYATLPDIDHYFIDNYVIFYIHNLLILFALFSWIFFLISTFTRTQKKAKQTVTHIHEIWNDYANSGEIDRNIRHLQLISFDYLTPNSNSLLEISLNWTGRFVTL